MSAFDTVYQGQTFRVTISDILDPRGNVIPDPEVDIQMIDQSGAVTDGLVVQDGSDWYAEFAPDATGFIHVRASASDGNVAWKTRVTLIVTEF